MNESKRNPVEIRVWMLRNGLKRRHMAAEIGVDPALVGRTIDGTVNNVRVLRYLIKMGCPMELLGPMPKRGKAA